MSDSSATFLVMIGTNPDLSLQELSAVFTPSSVKLVHPQFARIQVSDNLKDYTPRQIMRELGGVIKLLKPVTLFPLTVTNETIQAAALEILTATNQPKVTFGLGSFGVAEDVRLDGMQLKHSLIEQGSKARWVTGPLTGLGAAVLIHHSNIIELVTIKTDKGIELVQTLAAQDINEWTLKDRGKPYADHTKGMLPPKLARVMVNIALGSFEQRSLQPTVLLDPFCGSGTILSEALLAGVSQVIGSDVDALATAGTEENLTWLATKYDLVGTWSIHTSDATHIDERLQSHSVTHLVTEPFLGKQTPQPHQIRPLLKGLHKLYLGAFKAWTQILTDEAEVVIVFPHFGHIGQNSSQSATSFSDLVDKIAQFGYTPLSLPVMYSRPGATTQRQIWHFRYTKPE